MTLLSDTDDATGSWPPAAAAALAAFWVAAPTTFPRFQNLLAVLAEKLDAILQTTGSEFRGIVFVQQRVMVGRCRLTR
jgi:hypothetical protein